MKTLQQIDAEIAQCEQRLAVLHEQRREWVNHLGLNKRVIRDEDFKFTWGKTREEVKCVHKVSGSDYTHPRRNGESEERTEAAARRRLAKILALLGWVHAS